MLALLAAALKVVLSVKFLVGFVSGAAAGWGAIRAFAAFMDRQAKKILG